jgi:hypothetical protein
LAAIDNVTVPLAFPLLPVVTEIQESIAPAFHAQPLSVEIPTVDTPPAAGTLSCVRLNVNAHGAAAWVNETVVDATISEAERDAGTALADTEYETLPSPCPPADPLIEIQVALELAVHEQSRSVETETEPAPPPAPNDADVALSVALHLGPSGAATEVEVLVEQLSQHEEASVRKNATDGLSIGTHASRCTPLANARTTIALRQRRALRVESRARPASDQRDSARGARRRRFGDVSGLTTAPRVASATMALRTTAGEAEGCISRYIAATPATSGAAYESLHSSVARSCAAVLGAPLASKAVADVTPMPGAKSERPRPYGGAPP